MQLLNVECVIDVLKAAEIKEWGQAEDMNVCWPACIIGSSETFWSLLPGWVQLQYIGGKCKQLAIGTQHTQRGGSSQQSPLQYLNSFFHNLIFSDFFMYSLLLWHNLLTLSPSHQISFSLEEEFLLAWRPFVVWPLFSLLTLFVSSSLITASDKVSGRWLASKYPDSSSGIGSRCFWAWGKLFGLR